MRGKFEIIKRWVKGWGERAKRKRMRFFALIFSIIMLSFAVSAQTFNKASAPVLRFPYPSPVPTLIPFTTYHKPQKPKRQPLP